VQYIDELRQYKLVPGKRDVLIELFERELVETQEAVGMDVVGTFRDADDPDRFVWLRGFPDMESRARSLAAFYGGPVWKAHRDVANATMIDSDNVLLLRPAWADSGFRNDGVRAPVGAKTLPAGLVVATICSFSAPAPKDFVAACRRTLPVLCAAANVKLVAAFVTEPSANTFPALPVREGENVFVWFALFKDAGSARALALPPDLERALSRPPEILRLVPTARSRLRA
jgi:NIPSNAP protein